MQPNIRPRRVLRVLPLAATALLSVALLAQSASPGLPTGRAETLGFSPDRLARLDAVMQQYVDQRRIAGVVTLVARHGRIAHLKAYGQADRERQTPMATDTIFRIASMSKAVTTVAAMMLVEEGRLALSDPVSRFIPAFKNTSVRVPLPAGAPSDRIATVPAKREITIRDLMTHTAGISYGVGPAEALYKAANAYFWYFADKSEPIGRVVERLAALPFDAQPGEQWVYGFNTDILGHIVEKASSLTLEEFFRTRIFEPLRMSDTHFYLPRDKASRLATVYSATSAGTIERAPDAGLGQGAYVDGPRMAFSGGAGLLSTASDYARFLQMLLNGGSLDGKQLLSPTTVKVMRSNHVGTLYRNGQLGFGLGFEITEDIGRAGRLGSAGDFGWAGAYFTRYWVDPQAELLAVFMTQLLPSGGLDLQDKFRTLVYQALVNPDAPPPAADPRRTASTTSEALH